MTQEEIYDAEIASELLKIVKRCRELGMSMVASVAWDPASGSIGRTETYIAGTHVNQALVHWAARCHGNVDALIQAIDQHAREHGHSSICLQQLGNHNIKYNGVEVAALTVSKPS